MEGSSTPQLSPAGDRVAYSWAGPNDDNWDIYVKAIGPGTRPLRLTEHPASDWDPVWSPDGQQIAFVRETEAGASVHAIPFPGGQERRLADLEGPVWPGRPKESGSRWPRSPQRTCLPGSDASTRTRGTRRPSPIRHRAPAETIPPAISPDGSMLAFVRQASAIWGDRDIWVQPTDGGTARQLTFGQYGFCCGLAWSPEGDEIVFDSLQSGNWDLYVVDSEGGVPQRLTHEPSDENTGTFSRDGRSVYFSSDRSGRRQVWKMPAEGGEAVQVTRGGGAYAEESWDGQYVYYSKSSGAIWRVPVDGGEETEVLRVPESGAMWGWALSEGGIHSMTWRWRLRHRRSEYTIQFLDFASGRATELLAEEGSVLPISLAVSPDERWILYSEVPMLKSELKLVENFR